MSYSEKFHLRRIGKPIYKALAIAVSAAAKNAGVQLLPIADVGSSIGVFLSEFLKLNEKADKGLLVGVDFGDAVIKHYLEGCSTLFVHNLQSNSIPEISGAPFSIMTSWETAEHVDEKYADKIVGTFSKNLKKGGLVIFGAALPGQRGKHHVNCQPLEYWQKKFANVGIIRDDKLTEAYRTALRTALKNCGLYFRNTYCFIKK